MDDDQMEAFDEKLAEIFRQKKVEKNDRKSKWAPFIKYT
jgi:hypothetical protein